MLTLTPLTHFHLGDAIKLFEIGLDSPKQELSLIKVKKIGLLEVRFPGVPRIIQELNIKNVQIYIFLI